MKCVLVYLLTVLILVSAQVEELVSSNNLFAASLYKEVAKSDANNILVSPLSAHLIFSLIQFGAKGKTATELQDSLHISGDKEKTKSAVKTLLPSLLSYEPYYKFNVANKVYVNNSFQIKKEFEKTAVEDFFAAIENIDLSKKAEAADTVNAWVEEKTNHKIQNLLSPDAIDDDARIILVNALYFQSIWLDPFLENATKDKNFFVNATTTKQVPMMYRPGVYNYAQNSQLKAQFLEVPFDSDNASMVFVLPFEKDGLASLENQTEKVLAEQQFNREIVDVEIPKFKMETSFDLKKMFKNLGVMEVFGNNADLTDMSDSDLYISAAVQKTFIKVNEEGVEAAAASYAIASERIGLILPPTTKDFHADHPFLFYIKVNGVIIFVGRVCVPDIDH